ncbi:hypothetical protein OHT68_24425 [Streptomyces canus]|uniref:hypothetical protein n=1 Tax=Streptomyces canus TaxID=58343 RepID=UPI002E2ABC2A|nr:hypothetical protein [Streptomyces canus]
MKIDGDTLAAFMAAGVSVAAAVISGSQARSAKRQVDLMQRQIDGDERARHEESGPQFEVVSGEVDRESDVNAPRGVIVVKQTQGPALRNITVTPSGPYVEGIQRREPLSYEETLQLPGQDYRVSVTSGADLGSLATGGTVSVFVDLEYNHFAPVPVHLRLECQARDGDRTWVRDLTHSIDSPPPVPPSRRGRRG